MDRRRQHDRRRLLGGDDIALRTRCAAAIERIPRSAPLVRADRRDPGMARAVSGALAHGGGLISLDERQYRPAARETFGRPVRFTIVVFRNGWHARRKFNPWLLGSRENMYIRWQMIWRVERSDPDEPDARTRPGVVAPERNPAIRTACDPLALAAIGRRFNNLRRCAQLQHPIGLDHGIQGE